MTTDLITWLKARLDETEAAARSLLADAQRVSLVLQDPRYLGRLVPGWYHWPDVETVTTCVLAEAAAKRRILDRIVPEIEGMESVIYGEWGSSNDVADALIRTMALPYADRPGFLPEWAPEGTS